MERTFWRKQTPDKPLFPDLLWSRPEQKAQAGKLLIVGGNLHAFADPATAFSEAGRAGIGSVRVVLPDAAKKLVGPVLEQVEYAPSTPSGSFAQSALGELLDASHWADGVLLAGDLGRNSETAILLEKFAEKYPGQLTIVKDAADYAVATPNIIHGRNNTLLVLSFAQLQRLAVKNNFDQAFTFDMDLLRFVDTLHAFSKTVPWHMVVKHGNAIHAASDGRIITTRTKVDQPTWRLKTAVHTSVWWLQNPSKPLESLATALQQP